jgi:methylenetetrahydrofolate dehydrogenase (NADP+)/methenyltetrahydrofolate cyclohydrolase
VTAEILDGKRLAEQIRERIAGEAADLASATGRPPGLAVVLVGEDPASTVYVRKKEEAARESGFHSVVERLEQTATQAEVLDTVSRLAADPAIDGMLVQLPLPEGMDPEAVQRAVPPAMDVDGFHPENAGRLLLGRDDGLISCTPRGVMALVDEAGVELKGSEAVVLGRSNIVGKPVSMLLLRRHATVTLCHSRTRDLSEVCRRADVLVASVGVPGLVRGDWVKPGAAVIDVGISRITDPEQAEDLLAGQDKRLARFRKKGHALVGDVHFGEARERAAAITPVPGGVGPLTVAMLLENTLIAARRRRLGHSP